MHLSPVALIASVHLALAPPALADITRGCKASWVVRGGTTDRTFGLFDSRGSCKNRIHANDCRRQARDFALNCFRDAWGRRWQEDIRHGVHLPPNCLGRGYVGVHDYGLHDVKSELERQACSMQFAPPFRVLVIGRVWGDTGCGAEIVLSGTYEIRDNMCGKS